MKAEEQKLSEFMTRTFSSMRHKSKRRGHEMPKFSKNEFVEWLYTQDIEIKWKKYIDSGYNNHLRPSVDRIDDYVGYEFENMQVITWRENHIKGINSIKHHERSKNQHLTKPCFLYTKSGEFVAAFENYKKASIHIGCHHASISRAVTGKRKTLKGYIVSGQELTIKE